MARIVIGLLELYPGVLVAEDLRDLVYTRGFQVIKILIYIQCGMIYGL